MSVEYYNQNAQEYIKKNHELSHIKALVEDFLALLPISDTPFIICDAGSGTGRDTLTFLEKGCQVFAFDASTELARFSSQATGVQTHVMTFEDLTLPQNTFDGIWAMASLLHVSGNDLPRVLVELGQSLKPGGKICANFKKGSSLAPRTTDEGRTFTDIHEDTLKEILDQCEGLTLSENKDNTAGKTQTNQSPWISIVLTRTGQPKLKVATKNAFSSF